jgi:hypothetical protein
MTTLMIKDLALTEELDRSAMAAVHGGRLLGGRPSFDFDLRFKDDHSFNSSIASTASIVQGLNVQTAVGNDNSFAFADKGLKATANVAVSQNANNGIYVR